jgi:hypothetical protein
VAKAPQETKTYYICPFDAAQRKWAWRGMCPKRHRERCPECPHEPFGVSYKTADLEARVEAAERKADEQGDDEGGRNRAVKSARNTFFSELAKKGIAKWRAGRGRAMALGQAVDGGRLVQIVVPPQAQPGHFFPHHGVKGLPLKRTPDGRYVESKEEDVWEQEPDARSEEATLACPIGPVPDPRPACMIITVWAREQRPSEAAKAAAKAAEAEAKAAHEAALEAALEAAWETDDDDADNESNKDDEEGEAEEGEAAPATPAAAAALTAPTAPAVAPADAVAMPAAEPAVAAAAPAAAPVAVAADGKARIEAAAAAALAEATQGGMCVKAAQRAVRCSRALTS